MKRLVGMPLGVDSRAGMPKSVELGLNPSPAPLTSCENSPYLGASVPPSINWGASPKIKQLLSGDLVSLFLSKYLCRTLRGRIRHSVGCSGPNRNSN